MAGEGFITEVVGEISEKVSWNQIEEGHFGYEAKELVVNLQ